MSLLGLMYVTCLTTFRFLLSGDPAAPIPEGVQLVLYTPVILFPPLIAILAGSLSMWEERTLETQSWHMTLPVSARRQWLIKLAMAMLTGVVGAVLLPVFVMMVIGVWFGKPLMFLDQAMAGLTIAGAAIFGLPFMAYLGFAHQAIPGFLLTALLLTLASFWCACAVKGTVRAILWFVPAMGAVVLAGRYGDWVAPRAVDLVVSKFDPFRYFRFTHAVASF